MRKSTKRTVVNILTLLCIIIGSFTVLKISEKILHTGVDLVILHDNIQFYNEQPRKTDAMTKEYLENNAARKELYNSKDTVVRIYSNSNAFLKLIFLLLASASFIFIPLIVIRNTVLVIRFSRVKKRKARLY